MNSQLLIHPDRISQHFRCHIYAKAKNGEYLYCNDQMLKDLGLKDQNDILGLTDFDLHFLAANEAKSLCMNDKKIIATAQSNIIIEHVTLASGNKSIAISYKEPLCANKKIIGIRGASIIVDKNEFSSQEFFLIHQRNINNASLSVDILTPREKECFGYLVKGLTAKQISKKINLSVRTVESHIEKIKLKFNCKSKAELIEKAFSIEFA